MTLWKIPKGSVLSARETNPANLGIGKLGEPVPVQPPRETVSPGEPRKFELWRLILLSS